LVSSGQQYGQNGFPIKGVEWGVKSLNYSRHYPRTHYIATIVRKNMAYAKNFMALTLLAMGVLVAPRWAAAESLLIVFRDKPPYSFVENGVAKGFLLERTRRVLNRAGIKAEFREMPPKRIFLEIEKNEQNICSFGWYKLTERERYARYSVPLHQDRPHVVLAGPRSAGAIRKYASLKGLLSDQALVLAGADGVSYGAELDAMINTFAGRVDRTLQSPQEIAKKLAAKRADFMLIDQDDYDYLTISNADFRSDDLVRIEYPDMPSGLKRYILCSQQVGDETMRRINAAIAVESVR
jgi:uncharacterized protein (TIGR02285 family)